MSTAEDKLKAWVSGGTTATPTVKTSSTTTGITGSTASRDKLKEWVSQSVPVSAPTVSTKETVQPKAERIDYASQIADVDAEIKRLSNRNTTFDVSPYSEEENRQAEQRIAQLEQNKKQLQVDWQKQKDADVAAIEKQIKEVEAAAAALSKRTDLDEYTKRLEIAKLNNAINQLVQAKVKADPNAADKAWAAASSIIAGVAGGLSAAGETVKEVATGKGKENNYDPNSKSAQLLNYSTEQKDLAVSEASAGGKVLGEALIGIGQTAALSSLAAINPSLPLVAMAAVAAGNKANEVKAQGGTSNQALIRGAISGGIEAATEKLPLDALVDLVKVGGKSALLDLMKQAGLEAAEESVSYVANWIFDKIFKDPNATFSWAELGQAAAGGALSGGIIGGGAMLLNRTTNAGETLTTEKDLQKEAEKAGKKEVHYLPGTDPAANATETAQDGVSGDTGKQTSSVSSAPSAAVMGETGNPSVEPLPIFERTAEPLPTVERQTGRVNPDDSVGAAPAGFDPYGEAMLKYGQLKPGENPARIVDNPAAIGDQKVSQSVQTATEAAATPDSMLGDIADRVMSGKDGLTYFTVTNDQTTQKAKATIEKDGYEESLAKWKQQVAAGNVSEDMTAMGALLYNAAANAGDTKQALDILSDYATMVRSGARAVQAARILKTLTPEGKLYYAQKSVDRIQEELNEKYGEGKYNITIPQNLADTFLKAETESDREAALKDIYKSVAKQIPSSFVDRWNAWRYFAMLGNARTHARNFLGNAMFVPVRMVKNAFATLGEAAVDKLSSGGIDRTKAALNYANKADRDLVVASLKDASNVQELLLGQGKYDLAKDIINENRRIFRTRLETPIEALRKGNEQLLKAEDAIFSKSAYAGALAGYLKANGVTIETASPTLLDNARAYAVKEAQKSTYRDANALSDFVSGLRFNGKNPIGKAGNVLLEGVLPFRRTPANILARGLEYSPAGLLKGLTYDLVKVKKGDITAAEAIDNIAAGLTGSGLVALGYILAKSDLVTGGGTGSEEKDQQEELMGGQNYALSIGDKNYTLDWLAPEAMPFFVGVELFNQLTDKTEGSGRAVNDVMESLKSISSPMMEMSMLSGVQDLLESISYSDKPLWGIISSAATNYAAQAFPTLFGQIERVREGERQSTYIDREGVLPNDLQFSIGKVANKTLGEFHQIPYIDAWGRTEDSGTVGERAFNNMLSPWYSSERVETEADKEIMRLLDAGQTGVAPDRVSQSYKVTYKENPKDEQSQSRYMTSDEYVQFSKAKGQKSLEVVSAMLDTDVYKNMTDEEKAKAIDQAYQYATHLASEEITGGKHDSGKYVENAQKAQEELGLSEAEFLLLYEKYGGTALNGDGVRDAYASGLDVTDYLNYYEKKPSYNKDGKQGYTIAETNKAIRGSGLSEKDQVLLWLVEKPEWAEQAAKIGVSNESYVKYKVAVNSIVGKQNAANIGKAIRALDIPQEDKRKLLAAN